MKRWVIAPTIALVLVAHPAAARWSGEATCEGPAPAPQPAPAPRPAPALPPATDPEQQARAQGLYMVNRVYTGDTVTRSGLQTTFGSTTRAANPGTAARLVTDVHAGVASGLEGVLWNERIVRSDGRYVAGHVYENFVFDGQRFVHDKYVFFQDDSELASLPAIPKDPVRSIDPRPLPPPPPPAATRPAAAAPQPQAPAPTAPREDQMTRRPSSDRGEPPAPPSAPVPIAPPRVARAAVALAPQADPLGRIEVLRGRVVHLWPRGFVDGAPAAVVGWRLRSGEVSAVGPVSGSGDAPLTGMWEHVAAGSAPFTLWFDVDVSVPLEGVRTVPATIEVLVRSPAIVE